MAKFLKRGKDAQARAEADRQVRETVERILDDIDRRGDRAVRELSEQFDNWSPKEFFLSPAEIETAKSKVAARDLEDVAFAQEQVGIYAEAQKA